MLVAAGTNIDTVKSQCTGAVGRKNADLIEFECYAGLFVSNF